MKKSAMLILIALVTLKGYAMTPEEQNKIIATDRARWAGIKTLNVEYAAPPTTWKRVQDTDLHFSLYFPCDPKKTPGDLVTYTCVVNHISYSAIIGHGDFHNPNNIGYHEAGQSYQIQKRFLDSYGAPVSVTPIIHINYAGMTGRQEIIISNTLSAESRILYKDNLTIDLVIGAITGKLPTDYAVFFNSLQLNN